MDQEKIWGPGVDSGPEWIKEGDMIFYIFQIVCNVHNLYKSRQLSIHSAFGEGTT